MDKRTKLRSKWSISIAQRSLLPRVSLLPLFQSGANIITYTQAVLAISKEPNPTKYQKTLGLNDFYFGMPAFGFPMANIQMVGKSQGPMYKGARAGRRVDA